MPSTPVNFIPVTDNEPPGHFATDPGVASDPACTVTSDAERFLAERGLRSELKFAVDLAQKCFRVEAMTAEFSEDHDSDDTWVVLRINVRGSVEEVLAAKNRYTSIWVASTPAPSRFSIRLTFHIL